jgi:hypothetical protein
LSAKKIVLLPDHDVSGDGYIAAVLRILKDLDPRPTTEIVKLPDLGDGEDVADWIPRLTDGLPKEEVAGAVILELKRLWAASPVVDWDAVSNTCTDGPTTKEKCRESAAPTSDSLSYGPNLGDEKDLPRIPVQRWPDPPTEEAFQGPAGLVTSLIAPTTEADPAGILIQFLIGFGNALGRSVSVMADGHDHHANEFGVTVGATSRSRKGTAWRRVRAPMTMADTLWAGERIATGLSSGEGLVHELRDTVLGTDKKTGQEMVVDAGVSDKRLLIVEGEFGNVLRVLTREGNTLSSVLRSSWDGDNLRTMTKNSPTRATNPHVSLIGHITLEELRKYLDHTEVFNGLANRILWACVKRSKLLPFGGSLDHREMEDLGRRLSAILTRARELGMMRWSASGRKLWETEYGPLTEERAGLWGAATSRAEAHVLRLSMLYAALDGSPEIVDAHVLAALAVWRFCDRSAAYVFGNSLGDKDADAIRIALWERHEGMTRSEIRRFVFQDHKTGVDVAQALALLERFNLARHEPVDTGGRRAERWFAVFPETASA